MFGDLSLDTGLQIAQFGAWLFVAWFSWQQSRHRATREHVDVIEQRLVDQERKLDVLYERIAHLPTADQVAHLSIDLRAATTELRGVDGHIKSLNKQIEAAWRRMDRVEEYLSSRPT